MKLNTKTKTNKNTHEGARAAITNPEQRLRRSVLSCLLWEKQFYEDGQSIADRIIESAQSVPEEVVHSLAIEARTKFNLRHVPLLLCATKPDAQAIYSTINRADELAELLAIYWRDGKKPLPAQMKKGLAKAFTKFNAYQLAKYNRDNAVKLRDVMFMVHPKPLGDEQAATWRKLVDGTLEAPDTWEVALSGGADKKETFERLIRENKLGSLALLRNLRNMIQSGVDNELIKRALTDMNTTRILPFRFLAAARHAPQFEPELDAAMMRATNELPKLTGKTAVLVDVSVSMNAQLSQKSDMTRMDAAAALASIIQGESVRVFSFSSGGTKYIGDVRDVSPVAVEVPPRKGMAGIDAIINSQERGGTMLGQAIKEVNQLDYDRLIVITDEQSQDRVGDPKQGAKGYMINVSSYENGVGYGRWTHIDGFSENVIRYIYESENLS